MKSASLITDIFWNIIIIIVTFNLFSGITLKQLNSDFFPNFNDKNHHKILVIQTIPLACQQTGIQTVYIKIFRQLALF